MAKTAVKRVRDRKKVTAPKKVTQVKKAAAPARTPKEVKGRRRAADETLPGMDDFDRDKVLSKCAGKVADERFSRSESELREADWLVMAHKQMKSKGLFTYSAHGVDFIRTPGEETFKAKWKKGDDKNAARDAKSNSVTQGEQEPEPAGDAGDGTVSTLPETVERETKDGEKLH